MAVEKQTHAITGKVKKIEYTQPTLTAEEKLNYLRIERNRRLQGTDVWALSDRTMTQKQKDYRQSLRDITKTATSLDDVTWPTKP
tara:strand:+ start:149 stop:403 length:255 start_codon:yes stop_codon:yes gene_type:complete